MKTHSAIASFALFLTSGFALQAYAGVENTYTISLTCYVQSESVVKTSGNIVTVTAKPILTKITNRTIIDQVARDQNLSFSSKATIIGLPGSDTLPVQILLVVRDQGIDYPIENSAVIHSMGSYISTVKVDNAKKTVTSTLSSGRIHASYSLGDITVAGLFPGNSKVSGIILPDNTVKILSVTGSTSATVTGTDGNTRDYEGTIKGVGKYVP